MPLLAVLVLAARAALAPPPAPTPVDTAELRGEALMEALRAGGYTILLRHARTDRSVQEPMGTVPAERSAQRNLSDAGVRDARLMGVVLRKYRIPIGEIVVSPMFRAVETAEYAAGRPTTVTMALRVFPSTPEQAALVAAAPRAGTNRLLVTHHFVIETHVPGIRPGDVAESEAAVVRPTGDGRVALAGRITLADWERLGGVVAESGGGTRESVRGAAGVQPAVEVAIDVAIPETRAGRVATRYLQAFNTGDTARMRAFIDSSLVPDPARPTEARLQTFARTFEDFAPLAVTRVVASSEDELMLAVRTRRGDYVLVTRASPDQPGRARSIALGTTAGGHP